MQVKFASDTKYRKQWFTGLHFSHPAKMHLSLQLWLIDRYTKAGDVILDPMAGSGTILLACSMDRNVIAVELEDKFCKMMQGNWEKIQERGPQMAYAIGWAKIIQGDARNLEGVLADSIITSPPYGNPRDIDEESERDYEDKRLGVEDKQHGRTQFRGRYELDAVITSPPYEGSLSTEKDGIDRSKMSHLSPHCNLNVPPIYSQDKDNIGNLKSDSYLAAMLQVYEQCCKVLKDNGLMILVLKNFIRDKKIIRLDLDTIKLCEQAGFTLEEQHYRKLTAQSFWRTIYYQKNPEVERIDKEDILVFRKAGKGGIVDEVVMSPPYAEAETRDRTSYQEGRVSAQMDYSYPKSKTDNASNIGNLPYGEIDNVI